MKLWALGVYEKETDREPAFKGYTLADTLEEVDERVKKSVPGVYKLIALDISDSSAYYNRAAFPPNGVIWSPFPPS